MTSCAEGKELSGGRRGHGVMPLASQLIPSSASPFLGGRGGTEGTMKGSRAREGPHPLSSVHLAGLVRTGHSFLSMLGRPLGPRVWPPSVLISRVGCW